MVVCLSNPKLDLSESVLNPTKILGEGDIWITHPDVTAGFDWLETAL